MIDNIIFGHKMEKRKSQSQTYTRWLEDLSLKDLPTVGGKNAALGELHRSLKEENVPIPPGFAVTAEAYRDFLAANAMVPKITSLLDALQKGKKTLEQTGSAIRKLFHEARFPEKIVTKISNAYRNLCGLRGIENMAVAVAMPPASHRRKHRGRHCDGRGLTDQKLQRNQPIQGFNHPGFGNSEHGMDRHLEKETGQGLGDGFGW